MQYQDIPSDAPLANFVDWLKRMDERIRCRKGQTSIPPATHNTPKAGGSTLSTATGTHPGPMDLSANRGKKIPQEERERRMRLGLCMYCGASGHLARACPRKTEPGPIRAAATTTVTPEAVPAATPLATPDVQSGQVQA